MYSHINVKLWDSSAKYRSMSLFHPLKHSGEAYGYSFWGYIPSHLLTFDKFCSSQSVFHLDLFMLKGNVEFLVLSLTSSAVSK